MPVVIDTNALGPLSRVPTAAIAPPRGTAPSRLLVLQNPGRVSRHYLEGIINAASRLGIEHRVCELGPVWERKRQDIAGLTRNMAEIIRRERVAAVLSYICNGMTDFECRDLGDGRIQSVFGRLGVRHLMLWTDHPQWANEKAALAARLQPLLRSPNNVHFVKSDAAALELRRVLGWSNCFGIPMGEDAELIRPINNQTPEFDLVAILGSPPRPEPVLESFLDQEAPNLDAMTWVVAKTVREALEQIWQRDVPPALQPEMRAMGDSWVDRRAGDILTASVRHLPTLQREHAEAVHWLLDNPRTYFDAVEQLWRLTGWQRTFYLRYLGKYFRVAVFGSDWSSVGIGGGGWVPYHEQARYYARAKVAINISQGGEEEGLSHKPFQIAAAGVPMVHVYRKGLEDCFALGQEVIPFTTPVEAREAVAMLIHDDDRRAALAAAARHRLERDHTWGKRLTEMFRLANLELDSFRATAPALKRHPLPAGATAAR